MGELIRKHSFGRFGNGTAYTTGGCITAQCHHTSTPSLPRFQQCMRKEWQGARLMADVMQEQLNQSGLEFPAAAPGGLFDGTPTFVGAHRANIFLILCQ